MKGEFLNSSPSSLVDEASETSVSDKNLLITDKTIGSSENLELERKISLPSLVQDLEELMPDGTFQPISGTHRSKPKPETKSLNSDCVIPIESESITSFSNELITILGKYGWKYNPNEQFFNLDSESSSLRMSWDTLIARNSKLRQRKCELETFGFNPQAIEERLMSDLEEDVLMAKIQRQIQLIDSVSTSLTRASECVIDFEKEKQNMIKHFFSVKKKIPRYAYGTKNMLLPFDELGSFLTEKVFKEAEQKVPKKSKESMLRINVYNDPDDLSSVILHAKGRKDLIIDTKTKAEKLIKSAIAQHNLQSLVSNKASLELDIMLDASKDLGAFLVKPKEISNRCEGLWIESTDAGGQIRQILSRATERGAALVKINGKRIYKLSDKNKIINEVLSESKRGRKEEDKWIIATVCMSEDADLSSVDSSRLVYQRGNCLRRRDGTVYRGRWNLIAPRTNNHNIHHVHHDKQDANHPSSSGKKRKADDASAEGTQVKKRPAPNLDAKAKQNYEAYQQFLKKYQEVRDIDFKPFGINALSASKSMWNQHKKIFGESCDDNCKCVCNIAELTKNVVGDYIKKMTKKEKNWANPMNLSDGRPTAGFSSHFCGKFFNKVQREFPKDSSAEILEKLLKMWKVHRKERRFSMQCGENCPCGEGWEPVFLPECKRIHASKATPPAQRMISSTSSRHGTIEAKSRKKEYHALFNPRKAPLGFYCITEGRNGLEKNSKCVITSVSQLAKAKEESIQVGTYVVACASVLRGNAVQSRIPISSHTQLKQIYDALKIKRENAKLRVWFDNSNVLEKNSNAGTESDWSGTGAWMGQSDTPGWAGGASYAKKNNDTLTAHQLHQNKVERNRENSKAIMREVLSLKRKDALRHNKDSSSSASIQNNGRKGLENDHIAHALPVSPQQSLGSCASSQQGAKINTRIPLAQGNESKNNNSETKKVLSQASSTSKASLQISGVSKPVSQANSQISNKLQDIRKRPSLSSLESTTLFTNDKAPVLGVRKQGISGDLTQTAEELKAQRHSSLAKQILQQKNKSQTTHDHKKKLTSVLIRSSNKSSFAKLAHRRVTFSQNLEQVKYFTKDQSEDNDNLTNQFVSETSNEMTLMSDQKCSKPSLSVSTETIPLNIPVDERRNEELIDAALHKSLEEMINCLKGGASANYSQKRRPLNEIKKLILEVENKIRTAKCSSEFNDLSEELKVLKRKTIALKIYTQAEFTIDVARYLEDSKVIQVSPLIGKHLELTDLAKNHASADFLSCAVLIDGRIQEPLMPLIPFSGNGSVDWTKVQYCPSYHAGYNSITDPKYRAGREVELRLLKGTSSIEKRVILSAIKDSLDSLNCVVDSDQWKVVSYDFAKSKYLLGGKMDINCRKVACSENYIDRKRKEVAQDTSRLIDWIQGFQREMTSSNAPLINGDIISMSCGNFSILHAAVFSGDPNVVQRLLALGANPEIKSDVGTAIDFAVNLAEKSRAHDNGKECAFRDIVQALKASAAFIKATRSVNKELVHDTKNIAKQSERMERKWESYSQLCNAESKSDSIMTESHHTNTALHPIDPSVVYDRTSLPSNNASYAHNVLAGVTYDVQLPPPLSNVPRNSSNLPTLSTVDWALEKVGKWQRCEFFNEEKKCNFGKNCKKAHVCLPLGIQLISNRTKDLDVIEKISIDPEYIHVNTLKDDYGRPWFTAAYCDPDTSIIYYAEGGIPSYQSAQGIYWYFSKEDAVLAVNRVFLVANNEESKKKSQIGSPEEVNPNNDNSEMKSVPTIFKELLKENLQCIYIKVFPGTMLPKKCWETHYLKPGAVTVTLTSPAKEDESNIYYPSGCGGTEVDGKWFYKDEKAAKAATFYQFLQKCAERGLVKKNLKETNSGKSLIK